MINILRSFIQTTDQIYKTFRSKAYLFLASVMETYRSKADLFLISFWIKIEVLSQTTVDKVTQKISFHCKINLREKRLKTRWSH